MAGPETEDFKQHYDRAFFEHRNADTRHAAETILAIVTQVIPPIASAVDFGCGVGTWLSVLKRNGVATVRGYDGSWVDRSLLEIGADEFVARDLNEALPPSEKYDLAISLEVAEHLPPGAAESVVTSLTALSDFVLFSAAIPGQGGVNHLNEQWQGYWGAVFALHAYVPLDIVRPLVWNDKAVPWPYRQNTILYAKGDRLHDLRKQTPAAPVDYLSIVHPELFSAVTSTSIRRALHDLRRAIVAWI